MPGTVSASRKVMKLFRWFVELENHCSAILLYPTSFSNVGGAPKLPLGDQSRILRGIL